MKAAPHVRVDGTITRPVGTLDEMLARVHEETAPPWSRPAWERFITNMRLPQRRRELRESIGVTEGDQ